MSNDESVSRCCPLYTLCYAQVEYIVGAYGLYIRIFIKWYDSKLSLKIRLNLNLKNYIHFLFILLIQFTNWFKYRLVIILQIVCISFFGIKLFLRMRSNYQIRHFSYSENSSHATLSTLSAKSCAKHTSDDRKKKLSHALTAHLHTSIFCASKLFVVIKWLH